MSTPPETSSRFPIPLEQVQTALDNLSGFDERELEYMTDINGALMDARSPFGHMMDFVEHPALYDLAKYSRPPYHPYKDGRPDYSPIAAHPPFAPYRIGALVGQVVINNRELAMQRSSEAAEDVYIDPARQYTMLPEDPSGDALERYLNEDSRCDVEDMYIDMARKHGYFTPDTASDALRMMTDAWKARDLGVLALDNEQTKSMSAGFLLRSMFQLFRLYKIGEQEQRFAPWHEPYDRQKHRLDDWTELDGDFFANMRRWHPHMKTSTLIAAEDRAAVTGRNRSKLLEFGRQITGVGRGLYGYVPHEDGRQGLGEVLFRDSKESHQLNEADALVVARNGAFRVLRWPFIARTKGLSPMAVVQDGTLKPLTSSVGIYEQYRFLTAANEALTGRPEMDSSQVDACNACFFKNECPKDAAMASGA